MWTRSLRPFLARKRLGQKKKKQKMLITVGELIPQALGWHPGSHPPLATWPRLPAASFLLFMAPTPPTALTSEPAWVEG